MPDAVSRPRPSRALGATLALVTLASLAALPLAAQSIQLDAAKPKPPKPTGFPVAPGVYRLDGSDPDLGTADLEPLRKIIGGAPVVGLGESVHTSGGYYETKHRIFRFLVEKMGFRALAFENNWEEVEPAAQYVQTCSGSAEEAISSFYGVWRSAELAHLVQWMCEWNRNHPRPKDKVHLFGFDTQQPYLDGPALVAFLERIGLGPDHPWATAVLACDGVRRFHGQPLPDSLYQPCVEALDAIQSHFDANARQITRQTSAADLAWARIRLAGLRGWQGQMRYLDTQPETLESRDGAMAYVFRSIRDLRYRNLRTAVWAHNAHLWENPHPFLFWSSMLGTRLREIYGRGYVSIGLISSDPEIDWLSFGCGQSAELLPSADSVEARLESLGHDFLLADLVSPANPPFFAPGQTWDLYYAPVEPRLYFDALVWLRHSRKMDPLAWPSCR